MTVPEVVPLRLAYNRLYAVRAGGEWLLIDAGPAYHGAFSELVGQLATQGVPPGSVSTVLLTHGHLDHAGLAGDWQERGARIGIGAGDLERGARPALSDEREVEALIRYLREAGLDAGAVEEARTGLEQRRRQHLRAATAAEDDPEFATPQQGNWPFTLRLPPFQPDFILEGGSLFADTVTVFEAPGHTAGNCIFQAGGAIFSGDQLVAGITPVPAVQFLPPDYSVRLRSLPLFLRGLHLIKELKPAVVYPGHGDPIADPVAEVDRQLAQVEKRCARIRQELGSGPLTTLGVTRALYPRLPGARLWQVLGVVNGHLDLLEERGEAVVEGGLWRRA